MIEIVLFLFIKALKWRICILLIPIILTIIYFFIYNSANRRGCEIGCIFNDLFLLIGLIFLVINYLILGIGFYLSSKLRNIK